MFMFALVERMSGERKKHEKTKMNEDLLHAEHEMFNWLNTLLLLQLLILSPQFMYTSFIVKPIKQIQIEKVFTVTVRDTLSVQ